jgi:hypothetical protein
MHWVWASNHVDVTPAFRGEATTDGDWAEWGAVDGTNFGSGPAARVYWVKAEMAFTARLMGATVGSVREVGAAEASANG